MKPYLPPLSLPLVLILLALPMVFGAPATSIYEGMVAHYSFDTGDARDYVQGNDGVFGYPANADSHPEPYRNDSISQALYFHEKQFINITQNAQLDDLFLNQNYTISFWMKVNKSSTLTDQIFIKGNVDTEWVSCYIDATSHLECAMDDGVTKKTVTLGALNFRNNFWQHIVFMYNYQDGYMNVSYNNYTVEFKTNSVIHPDTTGYALYLGRSYDATYINSNFSGAIDDFTIWNRTLTRAEVSYLYNKGNGTKLFDTDRVDSLYTDTYCSWTTVNTGVEKWIAGLRNSSATVCPQFLTYLYGRGTMITGVGTTINRLFFYFPTMRNYRPTTEFIVVNATLQLKGSSFIASTPTVFFQKTLVPNLIPQVTDYNNFRPNDNINSSDAYGAGATTGALMNTTLASGYTWNNISLNNHMLRYLHDILENRTFFKLVMRSQGDYLDYPSASATDNVSYITGGFNLTNYPRLYFSYVENPVVNFTSNSTNFTENIYPNKTFYFAIYAQTNADGGGEDTYIFNYSSDAESTKTSMGTWTEGWLNFSLSPNLTQGGWFAWQWWVNLTNGLSNISALFNISSNQGWGIDNCSTYKNKSLILYFNDEDYPEDYINVTLEVDINYTDDFGNLYKYSTKMSGNYTYSFCIVSNKTWIDEADFYMKYWAEKPTPQVVNRYYLFNYRLEGDLKNLTLYVLNTTSGLSDLQLIARHNSNYTTFKNIVGHLQRMYVDEGLWRTVQMDLSDEFGQLVYAVRELSTDYRLAFYNTENTLLYITAGGRYLCTSGVCQYTQLITPYSATVVSRLLGLHVAYNNNTKLINITWADPQMLTTSVTAEVVKFLPSGALTICNVTQTGSSGNISCSLSGYTGSVRLRVYSTGSPKVWEITQWIDVLKDKLLESVIKGGTPESSFYAFMLAVVQVGAGVAFGIVGALVMVMVSLIVFHFIGISGFISTGVLVVAIIASLFLAVKIRGGR